MSTNPVTEWSAITLPAIDPASWTSDLVGSGLRELRRIRAQLDAAQAVLVGLLAASAGRDTKARLARELSMSSSEANQATKVAEVIDRVPGAREALARGDVSADKLARIAPITDPQVAAELVASAAAWSPEELTKVVDRQRLRDEGRSARDRQRAKRYLSFFRDPDGGVGLRGRLPSLDGERVKAAIEAICEDRFRREHPERAPHAGAAATEPRDRRLADALVEAVCGRPRSRNERSDTDNPPGEEAAGAAAARTALIVTIDAETLDAQVVSGPVISVDDVADLVADARTDVYAIVRDLRGAVLKFGRSRRLATALQRLVLAVRDGGCCVPGCEMPWQRCDAHHEPPFEEGGTTDVDRMDLRCRCMHHPHRHEDRAASDPSHERAGPRADNPQPRAA